MTRESALLWTLGAITVLAMLYTYVAPYIHPSDPALAKSSEEAATFIFKAGFGFLAGLIGGTQAAKRNGRRR